MDFAGSDITALPAWKRAHLGLARSFQIPRPFRGLTVRQNIEVRSPSSPAADLVEGRSDDHRVFTTDVQNPF